MATPNRAQPTYDGYQATETAPRGVLLAWTLSQSYGGTVPIKSYMRAGRRKAAIAGAASILLLVAGCSSSEQEPEVASIAEGGGEPTASAGTGGVDDGGLAFAKCMRENGIDFPDPNPDGGFGLDPSALPDLDFSDPKLTEAAAACQDLRPAGSILDEGFDEAAQEAAVKLTKCMRKNGIDIADPQFDANGQIILSDLLKDLKLNDPKFLKAVQECRKLLPADF